MLLLHNNSVLEGAVVRTESSFAVRDDRGNVRYVSPSQVAHRCDTISQAYRWKRRRIDRDDVRGHVRLAQWCLKNDLGHEATNELLHVSSIAPAHSSIRALERQLKNYYNAKSHADPPPKASGAPSVANVSYQKPLTPAAPRARERVQPPEDLRPLVVAEFKRSVQPILINRCGQIACHGAATKSDFRLNLHRNRAVDRRMTIQNLEVVMSHLDRAQLERSKLLTKSRIPHATMRRPAIGTHEFEIYQALLTWAKNATDDASQNTVEPAEKPATNGFTPAGQMLEAHRAKVDLEPLDESDPEFDEPITLVDPSQADDGETDSQDANDSSSASDGNTTPSTSDQSSSDDPFDPAAFNRRHAKRQ